jgi:hypothetical protein
MSITEQREISEKFYNEAVRYMDNAKESLKNANKEGNNLANSIIEKIKPISH